MVSIDRSAGEVWFAGLDPLRWALTTRVREPRLEEVSGVGDETSAAAALRAVERGRYLVYRGHYANALQLLAAMRRRLSNGARSGVRECAPIDADRYAREAKRREHDLLCRLVVLLNGTAYRPMLFGAPTLGDFGVQVWGPIDNRPLPVPLREWMGERERLGLRPPDFAARAAGRAGLVMLGRRETHARHARAFDRDDPLHPLRTRETITLHVLGRP